MTNRFYKEIPNLLIILAMIIGGIVAYPYLPDRMPSHWDFAGNVNGYSDKFWGTFSMPLITLGVYALLAVLPAIDPRRDNYGKFTKSYEKIKSIMVLFFAVLYGMVLLTSLGYMSDMSRAIIFLLSCLFIVLGNYFGKIRQNYFVGFKFPWTLADEEVWNKTHRLGGKLWVISGFVGLFSVFFDGSLAKMIFFGLLIASSIATVIYSYVIYEKKKVR